MQNPKQRSPLIVICGESCGGKTSVMQLLREWYGLHHTLPLERVVTTTTRAPRCEGGKQEQNGVDYHFLDPATFVELEQAGYFIETDEYARHRYGTQMQHVQQVWLKSCVPICNATLPGVRKIQRTFTNTCTIFFRATTLEELEGRLRRSRSEVCSEVELQARLARAEAERVEAEALAHHILIAPDNAVKPMAQHTLDIVRAYLAQFILPTKFCNSGTLRRCETHRIEVR